MLLCILSFLCFSWLASAVLASIFGTVRGIVHDSQHHPIASAHVVLRARASDWQKEATTDDEGRFQIDAVSAGEYTIHITHEGFRNFDGSLAVSADSAPLLHFPLELATLTQRIEVNDGTDLVDTSSSTSQTTLTRETIEATPGATRANSLDFIANFTPGAYMVHDQLHVRGGHQVSW
ncbi:MAG: TonB-dependent receptor, partial [Acidobacteria bacterium]